MRVRFNAAWARSGLPGDDHQTHVALARAYEREERIRKDAKLGLQRGLQMPTGQEQRQVDPKTGGEKGTKLAAFDLIPWTIVHEIAEHFGRGARKYASRNWERGYNWSYSFAALHRHLEAFWSGDEIDHDPSLYVEGEEHTARHIIAVAWHALVLAFFSRYHIGTDDRPTNVMSSEKYAGPGAAAQAFSTDTPPVISKGAL